MIDTDKYEGHTAPWKPHAIQPLYGNMVLFGFNEKDALLASDAPLLLEEVKRLREQFKLAYDWVDTQFPDGGMADFAKYIGDEEE